MRRSTSYVAWKIFELTGQWPLERGNDGTVFHAKYWQEFLRLNGYTKEVEHPERGKHYVGIIPDEGEFGQVVWFEGMYGKLYACQVSTYTNFQYETRVFHTHGIEKTTWIEIY